MPSLPLALQRAGHEVSVVGPLWPSLTQSAELKIKPTGVRISVSLGSERVLAEVREARSPQGLQMFLFAHEGIFGQGAPAPMTAAAATLFSKLIVELARRLNPAPDVLQIQDWPGGARPGIPQSSKFAFCECLGRQ